MNLYAYVKNNAMNSIDPTGMFERQLGSIGKDPTQMRLSDAELSEIDGQGVIFKYLFKKVAKEEVKDVGKNQKHTFPDNIFTKKEPKQATPGTKTVEQERYNSKTGEYERSTVRYDQYGRMVERKDNTNHGYANKSDSNYHSNPHTHRYEYNERYPGGKETRINHD